MNEIRWLTGEEPSAFTAVASTRDHTSGRFAEVEQTLELHAEDAFRHHRRAGLHLRLQHAGLPAHPRRQRRLEIAPAYNYDGVHLRSLDGATHVDITSPGDSVYHFVLEAEHFANCIRTGALRQNARRRGPPRLLAIESIYKAAGTPIA